MESGGEMEEAEERHSNGATDSEDSDSDAECYGTRSKRLDSEERQELRERGVIVREGAWSGQEDERLKRNMQHICKKYNIDEPRKLIFADDYPDAAEIRELINREMIHMQLRKGIQRPVYNVYIRARKIFDPQNYLGRFSDEEVRQMKNLATRMGTKWSQIGKQMGRSGRALCDRFKVLGNGNRGPWSDEERERLIRVVKELSCFNQDKDVEKLYYNIPWTRVKDAMETRNVIQCRTEWIHIVSWVAADYQTRNTSRGQRWKEEDNIMLIEKIYDMDIHDEQDVDWMNLLGVFPRAPSPQKLCYYWHRLKVRCVPNHRFKTYEEIVCHLHDVSLPELRKKQRNHGLRIASREYVEDVDDDDDDSEPGNLQDENERNDRAGQEAGGSGESTAERVNEQQMDVGSRNERRPNERTRERRNGGGEERQDDLIQRRRNEEVQERTYRTGQEAGVSGESFAERGNEQQMDVGSRNERRPNEQAQERRNAGREERQGERTKKRRKKQTSERQTEGRQHRHVEHTNERQKEQIQRIENDHVQERQDEQTEDRQNERMLQGQNQPVQERRNKRPKGRQNERINGRQNESIQERQSERMEERHNDSTQADYDRRIQERQSEWTSRKQDEQDEEEGRSGHLGDINIVGMPDTKAKKKKKEQRGEEEGRGEHSSDKNIVDMCHNAKAKKKKKRKYKLEEGRRNELTIDSEIGDSVEVKEKKKGRQRNDRGESNYDEDHNGKRESDHETENRLDHSVPKKIPTRPDHAISSEEEDTTSLKSEKRKKKRRKKSTSQ